MSKLPVVSSVRYKLELPELKKTVSFRPLKIKEHKVLMTALELKEEDAIINALIDIIQACVDGLGQPVLSLPAHLVDFLYVNIWKRSNGNITPAVYNCKGTLPDETKCDAKFNLNLDLDNAKLFYPEDYERKKTIAISDDAGIRLAIPNFEDFKKIDLTKDVVSLTDQFILSCIECIYSGDAVMVPGTDITVEETIEWINNLDGTVLGDLGRFFDQVPYVGMDVPVTCPKCGKKETHHLRGLEDFFD